MTVPSVFDGCHFRGCSPPRFLPEKLLCRPFSENFQVLRRTVATHVQGMGSAKDTQTMLCHTKPDTAQISYVQPVEDSVRAAVDKLAATLLG